MARFVVQSPASSQSQRASSSFLQCDGVPWHVDWNGAPAAAPAGRIPPLVLHRFAALGLLPDVARTDVTDLAGRRPTTARTSNPGAAELVRDAAQEQTPRSSFPGDQNPITDLPRSRRWTSLARDNQSIARAGASPQTIYSY